MPILSLQKLTDLFSPDLTIEICFSTEETLFYVQTRHVATGEPILVYIPSDYEFDIRNVVHVPLHPVEYESLGRGDRDIEEHVYREIEPIEDAPYEKRYDRTMNVAKPQDDAVKDILAVRDQLSRFNLSLKGLSYKLAILHDKYFSVIRRGDGPINCYTANGWKAPSKLSLVVATDLEVFFDKRDAVVDECRRLRTEIERMVYRIHTSHDRALAKLKNEIDEGKALSNSVREKREKLEMMEKRMTTIVDSVNASIEEHDRLREAGVYDDKKYATLLQYRQKALGLQREVQTERQILLLELDQTMYQSTIASKRISDSFQLLRKMI